MRVDEFRSVSMCSQALFFGRMSLRSCGCPTLRFQGSVFPHLLPLPFLFVVILSPYAPSADGRGTCFFFRSPLFGSHPEKRSDEGFPSAPHSRQAPHREATLLGGRNFSSDKKEQARSAFLSR